MHVQIPLSPHFPSTLFVPNTNTVKCHTSHTGIDAVNQSVASTIDCNTHRCLCSKLNGEWGKVGKIPTLPPKVLPIRAGPRLEGLANLHCSSMFFEIEGWLRAKTGGEVNNLGNPVSLAASELLLCYAHVWWASVVISCSASVIYSRHADFRRSVLLGPLAALQRSPVLIGR